MRGFRSILWPTEFDQCSRAALQAASSLFGTSGQTLTALTVIDPLFPQAAAAAYHCPTLLQEYQHDLRAFTDDALASLPVCPRATSVKAVVGRPAREILRAARAERADVVVLGTHGRLGMSRLLAGSTAACVLRSCPTAVFALSAGNGEPAPFDSTRGGRHGTVLVVAHRAPLARGLLDIGADLARRLGTTVVVPAAGAGGGACEVEAIVSAHEYPSIVGTPEPATSVKRLAAFARAAGAAVIVLAVPPQTSILSVLSPRAYRLAVRTGCPLLVMPEPALARASDSTGADRGAQHPTAA